MGNSLGTGTKLFIEAKRTSICFRPYASERLGYLMNTKLIRFISYLVYMVAFGYFVIKADDFHRLLKRSYATDFDSTGTFMFMSLFPIIVGILLALPQFFAECKQKGTWKIDWIALAAMGLPSLLVAITPMLINLSSEEQIIGFQGQVIGFIVGFHPTLVTVAGILFGFVLVTSFSRQKSQ